jgi:hypothetical protein
VSLDDARQEVLRAAVGLDVTEESAKVLQTAMGDYEVAVAKHILSHFLHANPEGLGRFADTSEMLAKAMLKTDPGSIIYPPRADQ